MNRGMQKSNRIGRNLRLGIQSYVVVSGMCGWFREWRKTSGFWAKTLASEVN